MARATLHGPRESPYRPPIRTQSMWARRAAACGNRRTAEQPGVICSSRPLRTRLARLLSTRMTPTPSLSAQATKCGSDLDKFRSRQAFRTRSMRSGCIAPRTAVRPGSESTGTPSQACASARRWCCPIEAEIATETPYSFARIPESGVLRTAGEPGRGGWREWAQPWLRTPTIRV